MSARGDKGRGRPAIGHLDRNRGLIVERAAVAGALSLVPVPIVDELLAGAVRETLLRRIAEARKVDVSDEAVRLLSEVAGDEAIRLAIDASTLAGLFKRAWRSAAIALRVARRADELAGTFAVATLFDHYCALHHVGLGIGAEQGRELSQAIRAAVRRARGGVLARTARGGADRLLAAPRSALTAARKLLPGGRGGGSAEAAAGSLEVVEALDPALRQRRWARARKAFAGPALLWSEELVRCFDDEWRLRHGNR